MEIHRTATECHLPYGITQCYLLPDTSERTPPSPQKRSVWAIGAKDWLQRRLLYGQYETLIVDLREEDARVTSTRII